MGVRLPWRGDEQVDPSGSPAKEAPKHAHPIKKRLGGIKLERGSPPFRNKMGVGRILMRVAGARDWSISIFLKKRGRVARSAGYVSGLEFLHNRAPYLRSCF